MPKEVSKSAELAAFLIAALVPAAIRIGIAGDVEAGATAYLVALLHLAIAVPLYAWVKRRSRLTAPVAVLAGGAIGAVPMAIVTLPVLIRYPTEFLLSLALYGAIGATAGMVFWIVLELQRKRMRQSPVASLVAAGAAERARVEPMYRPWTSGVGCETPIYVHASGVAIATRRQPDRFHKPGR